MGLATARALSERFPERRAALVEKETGVASHQTGHDSGVLHSGIYYKLGSLKAALCRAGREAMIAFCQQEDIPYALGGKVIVAVDEAELGRLHDLHGRGIANGVACELAGCAAGRAGAARSRRRRGRGLRLEKMLAAISFVGENHAAM